MVLYYYVCLEPTEFGRGCRNVKEKEIRVGGGGGGGGGGGVKVKVVSKGIEGGRE